MKYSLAFVRYSIRDEVGDFVKYMDTSIFRIFGCRQIAAFSPHRVVLVGGVE
jgi:hypothetical protein